MMHLEVFQGVIVGISIAMFLYFGALCFRSVVRVLKGG